MSLGRVTLGNIRVVSPIGHGGMGDVYLGIDERLQRKVALKSIRAERRLDAGAQARFAREARILSQLDHPNICRVYDYIVAPEADVLVLEFIEGRPLTALLRETLSPSQKQRIAEQIAQALAAAHERGVVHRDLKPGNVMVTPSGDVKVVDFGLALAPAPGAPEVVPYDPDTAKPPSAPATQSSRNAPPRGGSSTPHDAATIADEAGDTVADGSPDGATIASKAAPSNDVTVDAADFLQETTPGDGSPTLAESGSGDGPEAFRTQVGLVLGTPFFMSPEQARGEPVTPASDMFAFGLMLQELFTGVAPHPSGIGPREIVTRVAAGGTQPPGPASRPLLALIRRLKAVAPTARPTALDALERLRWIRQQPRRRAFRLAIAAGLVALAAAGVKYTLDVRRARDVANRHRAQAEDLVGFMLGDLREKLEPVGQLALLGSTGDKALAYFAALRPGEVTDEDRFRQAQALMHVGQVRIAEGRTADAQQLFSRALDTTRELTASAPDALEWHAALGSAHFWVGYIHWVEGRLDEALAKFQEYLGVAQRLVTREPDKPEWQMELAQARNNLGAVLQAKGEFAGAVVEFREAVTAKQRLVDLDPARKVWRKELADSQSWLGDALRRTGDLAGAIEQFRANSANFGRLREVDPDNREWQHMKAISHVKIAVSLGLIRDLAAAVAEYEIARDLLLGLAAHDPTNLSWKRDLGSVFTGLGRMHLAATNTSQATAAIEPGLQILGAIVRADPNNADVRQQLATGQALLSRAHLLSGRWADALRMADEAAATIAPIGQNTDVLTQRRVAEASLARARALAKLGRSAEARVDLDRALAATSAIGPTTRDADLLALRAEALLRAGRRAEAMPLLAELDRQRVVNPELDEVR